MQPKTRHSLVAGLIFVSAALVTGCGQGDNKSGQAKDKKTPAASVPTQVAEEKKGHDHEDWWCDEHGVPEEVCGQCSPKVAAEFKKKGDWCKDHDRPKSQCFKCDPKLRDKFAAEYRAKYGKEPPAIEDDEKAKKDEKKG